MRPPLTSLQSVDDKRGIGSDTAGLFTQVISSNTPSPVVKVEGERAWQSDNAEERMDALRRHDSKSDVFAWTTVRKIMPPSFTHSNNP